MAVIVKNASHSRRALVAGFIKSAKLVLNPTEKRQDKINDEARNSKSKRGDLQRQSDLARAVCDVGSEIRRGKKIRETARGAQPSRGGDVQENGLDRTKQGRIKLI